MNDAVLAWIIGSLIAIIVWFLSINIFYHLGKAHAYKHSAKLLKKILEKGV